MSDLHAPGDCPGDFHCQGQHESDSDQTMIDYQMFRDYREGKWCGECRYGVVEDPPCCTAHETHVAGREDER